jgi:hypothetical protein
VPGSEQQDLRSMPARGMGSMKLWPSRHMHDELTGRMADFAEQTAAFTTFRAEDKNTA